MHRNIHGLPMRTNIGVCHRYNCVASMPAVQRLKSAISVLALLLLTSAWSNAAPLLQRFAIATIAAQDLDWIETHYGRHFDYRVRERGTVSAELAASWGAPAVAGRRYILLSPDSAPEVYVRAIESPRTEGYRALTSFGWNAIEIVVDDSLAENVASVIVKSANTGKIGDGKVFVSAVEQAIRIRTGETGSSAVAVN